jgi:chromosome segregation ATPase
MLFIAYLAAETVQKAEPGFFDTKTVVSIITALGIGGIIQAGFNLVSNRKKNASEANKLDTDAELAKLATVIDRLDDENKRIIAREQRTQEELAAEQERSSRLRARVRELEDEIDSVRASARETQKTAQETQRKCDELADRLKELTALGENGKE